MWFSQVINKIYLKIKFYISWFYIIANFNNIIILVWKYIILLHWVCYSYMDTRWTLTQANFGACRRAVLLFSFKTSMLINQGWNLKVMTRHFHHCELYNHLVTMNSFILLKKKIKVFVSPKNLMILNFSCIFLFPTNSSVCIHKTCVQW